MSEKYILVKLSDAKLLRQVLDEEVLNYDGPYAYVFSDLKHRLNSELKLLLDRIEQETGGDFVGIATQLKKMPICGACDFECQGHTCQSLVTNKFGRRLSRLIERANHE